MGRWDELQVNENVENMEFEVKDAESLIRYQVKDVTRKQTNSTQFKWASQLWWFIKTHFTLSMNDKEVFSNRGLYKISIIPFAENRKNEKSLNVK